MIETVSSWTKSLQLPNDVSKSVVQIWVCDEFGCETPVGTGVIVHSSGLILTAYHVLLENPDIERSPIHEDIVIALAENSISDPSPIYQASLVADNVAQDIALLSIDRTFDGVELSANELAELELPSLPFLDADIENLIDEELIILGYPIYRGIAPVYRIRAYISGFDDGGQTFVVDRPLQEGNSGGPVLTRRNNQMGIIGIVIRARTTLGNLGSEGIIRPIGKVENLTWNPNIEQVIGRNIQITEHVEEGNEFLQISMELLAIDLVDKRLRLLFYAVENESGRPWQPHGSDGPAVIWADVTPSQFIDTQQLSLSIPMSKLETEAGLLHFEGLLWDLDNRRPAWSSDKSIQVSNTPIIRVDEPTPQPNSDQTIAEIPTLITPTSIPTNSVEESTPVSNSDIIKTAVAATLDVRNSTITTSATSTPTPTNTPLSISDIETAVAATLQVLNPPTPTPSTPTPDPIVVRLTQVAIETQTAEIQLVPTPTITAMSTPTPTSILTPTPTPTSVQTPTPIPTPEITIPDGFNVQTDNRLGYSFALPRGWTDLDLRSSQFQNMANTFGMGDRIGPLYEFLDSEEGQNVGIVVITDLTAAMFGGLPTWLNVSVIDVPDATPESAIGFVESQWESGTFSDVEIRDLTPTLINNLPAVAGSATADLSNVGINAQLFTKVVALIANEKVYVMTLATEAARMAEKESVFEQIIGTFRPITPTLTPTPEPTLTTNPSEILTPPTPEVTIPDGFLIYTDDRLGYSFALPIGWSDMDLRSVQFQNMANTFGIDDEISQLNEFLDSKEGQGVGKVSITDLTAVMFGGLPTILNISVVDMPGATPEWTVGLIEHQLEANTSVWGDVEIRDIRPTVINNLPAVAGTVASDLSIVGIEGQMFAKVTALIANDKVYVMTLATEVGKMAEKEPIFDQIIDTFRPE
ncbi:MAG: trypsin-like peptidase domain-containing protein [Chloroflexota bacterium]